jgi:hypothetical protein
VNFVRGKYVSDFLSNSYQIVAYSRQAMAIPKGIHDLTPQVKVRHVGRAETLSRLRNDFISWCTPQQGYLRTFRLTVYKKLGL